MIGPWDARDTSLPSPQLVWVLARLSTCATKLAITNEHHGPRRRDMVLRDSDEGRVPTPTRPLSADEQLLANIALAMSALSVGLSIASRTLGGMPPDERAALRGDLSQQAGAIAEQLHELRRLVRSDDGPPAPARTS